ncbi:putative quinol monooxygenase [Amycolatopsis kentuckyensis]|uniref:putative quinol monooxygenase n=1 Tax=Amycolatopsis kentuckyensis TaxID=218823 RepID=UPI000A3BB9FA|nr:antibiotic biosynthesis monooxygenase [Amycolatopsis kentuckyensis]
MTLVPPDIGRAGVGAVLVGHRYAPDEAAAATAVKELARQWEGVPDVRSAGVYRDTEGTTVLSYVQYGTSVARDVPGGVVEYRLRRGVVPAGGSPGAIVIATFDVDGPDRQEAVISALVSTLESRPAPPGMLSAYFHASVDGTRVLNYAEWTTHEAHVAFLEGETRRNTLRVSTGLPGVRPIGFRRFELRGTPR